MANGGGVVDWWGRVRVGPVCARRTVKRCGHERPLIDRYRVRVFTVGGPKDSFRLVHAEAAVQAGEAHRCPGRAHRPG